MKAIVFHQYGSPDVLQLQELTKPTPKDNEILVKVHATTVTAMDCIFRRGDELSARGYTGLIKPKRAILGSEMSGEVEETGSAVTRFKQGDQIVASASDVGTYAEYICLPEDGIIANKPTTMSFEEAAAVPYGALTALHFLRDKAKLQSGSRILIIGASGSIGTYAVQLAKHFGAEVTGVCSSKNVEMVKSLGADRVIDYRKEDYTAAGETYDVVFDPARKSTFARCKHLLTPKGIYLTAVISVGILIQTMWTSLVGSKKASIGFAGMQPPAKQAQDLKFLKELIEAGTIKAVIDRRFPLEQVAEAHKYIEAGNKQGNVVITVG